MLFAKAKRPTPILNTPHFDKVFSHPLPLDDQGLLRPIEMIALADTPFHIMEQISTWIYQVTTPGYAHGPLFVDKRFLSFAKTPFPPLHKKLPSKDALLRKLYNRINLPYIWGGNWSLGAPELLDYYPPHKPLTETEKTIHCLCGVDCSGLLYEVSLGMTPRNTSELMVFGREASFPLLPLDLIVWKGHVVIVGKEGETIESRHPQGVVTTPLKKRLKEIEAAKDFVIRRWIETN